MMIDIRGKHQYTLIAAAVGVIFMGWIVWSSTRPQEVTVLQPVTNLPVTIVAIGNVDAERVAQTGFEVPGRLADVLVRVGDQVKAGQVLATLDQAQQELVVSAAEEAAAAAEATSTLKQQLVGRARGMDERGTGSKAAVADANAEAAIARATARKAQATLNLERTRLERQSLTAPFDGVVTAVTQAKGSVIQAGAPLVTVAELASYRILANVDEARAGMITHGQLAKITLRSRPQEPLQGKVERIAPQSDKVAEERQIAVVLDGASTGLYLAEQAEVEVTVGNIARGVALPERVIRERRASEGRVWAVKGDVLVDLPVRLGRRLIDGRVELISALPEDTKIIATRLDEAKAGETVSIVDEPKP